MTKNTLNQNGIYVQELVNSIEPDFVFSNKTIDRFKIIKSNNNFENQDKTKELLKLKEQINSIENCNLKDSSKNLILGNGNINSPIMIIGETPGETEDNSGMSFQGEIGSLLKKMLLAINIEIKKTKNQVISAATQDDRGRPKARQHSLRYTIDPVAPPYAY